MPQFEKRRFRPAQLLARLELAHEWLFQAIDHHRTFIARKGAWSQYLTSWAAEEILDEAGEVINDEAVGRLSGAHIAGLAAWRMTKGIYRFDVGFAGDLLRTPLHLDIQGLVLNRMPQWCVYVEADPFLADQGLHGFWAFAERSGVRQEATLHLLLDWPSSIRHVPVSLNSTLAAGVNRAVREDLGRLAAQQDGGATSRGIERPVSVVEAASTLVTYLCCSNAEIGEKGRSPRNPMAVRFKDDWALFPADGPVIWKVGQAAAGQAARPGRNGAALAPRFEVRDIVSSQGQLQQNVTWVRG